MGRTISVRFWVLALCAGGLTSAGCAAGGGDDDGAGAGHGSGAGGTGTHVGGSGGAAGGGDGGGGAGPVYQRVVLNFDDVASGTIITNQYAAHATFSSSTGCACEAADDAGVAASQPNYLFTYYTCADGPSAPIFVDFAQPIRRPSITLVGVNGTQNVATVRLIFVDDSTHEQSVQGLGDYSVPVVVDMAAVSGDVKRLELVNVNDAYGLGVDDVAFDFPE